MGERANMGHEGLLFASRARIGSSLGEGKVGRSEDCPGEGGAAG